METEAAVIMWRRSLLLHCFRYMEMLGDGDGKAHGKVNGIQPYGPEVTIKIIECVNHVTKRMGTALRTRVEKRKAQNLLIGGYGKLTDDRIEKLTNYYSWAIKDNAGNLKAMEHAEWASFFHTLSTDDDPHIMNGVVLGGSHGAFLRERRPAMQHQDHTPSPCPTTLLRAWCQYTNDWETPSC